MFDQKQIVVGGGGPGPEVHWWAYLRNRLWPLDPAKRKLIVLVGLPSLVLLTGLMIFLLWPKAPPPPPVAQSPAQNQPPATSQPEESDDTTPKSSKKEEKKTSTSKKSTSSGSGSSSGGSSGSSGGGSSGGSSSSSCALPAYPTESCTGVPSGWSPTTTINGNLVISTNGAVIENYLVKGTIDVRANNVTIRKTRVYGSIDNFITNVVYGPLLIEDTEVVLPPGETETDDYGHSFGVASYTCRRCKVVGRAEGWRVGASSYQGAGPVTIEDSYAKLQVTQAQCNADDPHGDGIQGYGGPFATIRHNTIDQRDDHCPTAPIFIPSGQGNDGGNIIDNVLAGGGFTLRAYGGSFPSMTGNKIVDNSWAYGPLDIDCNLIGTWSGNATVTFNWTTGKIINQVQALNDC